MSRTVSLFVYGHIFIADSREKKPQGKLSVYPAAFPSPCPPYARVNDWAPILSRKLILIGLKKEILSISWWTKWRPSFPAVAKMSA